MVENCDRQENDIIQIRAEFHEYKSHTNQRLDEIIEKLKPQFSSAQITTFIFSFIGLMVGAFVYITDLKKDGEKRELRIDFLEKMDSKKDMQYDVIMAKLNEIDKKVDVNAVKSKVN